MDLSIPISVKKKNKRERERKENFCVWFDFGGSEKSVSDLKVFSVLAYYVLKTTPVLTSNYDGYCFLLLVLINEVVKIQAIG